MSQVTLATLKQAARERADIVFSKFVTDAELTRYINASAAELYDVLVSVNKDYNTIALPFTIAGGVSSYALPATFYKMRGVDWTPDGGTSCFPVHAYNFLERGHYMPSASYPRRARVRYQVIGTNIVFLPPDKAPGQYQLWYVPEIVPLVSDSDAMQVYNGWDEYIITDAAIKCCDKEETDTVVLERQKANLLVRIRTMANDRDYGEPDRIANVRGGSGADLWE